MAHFNLAIRLFYIPTIFLFRLCLPFNVSITGVVKSYRCLSLSLFVSSIRSFPCLSLSLYFFLCFALRRQQSNKQAIYPCFSFLFFFNKYIPQVCNQHLVHMFKFLVKFWFWNENGIYMHWILMMSERACNLVVTRASVTPHVLGLTFRESEYFCI